MIKEEMPVLPLTGFLLPPNDPGASSSIQPQQQRLATIRQLRDQIKSGVVLSGPGDRIVSFVGRAEHVSPMKLDKQQRMSCRGTVCPLCRRSTLRYGH
jgi:hypothetical protein